MTLTCKRGQRKGDTDFYRGEKNGGQRTYKGSPTYKGGHSNIKGVTHIYRGTLKYKGGHSHIKGDNPT